MSKKNYRKNYTKAKVKRVYESTKPDFLVEVKVITIRDLKKQNLIDSRTYREYVKNKIKKDYDGGNADE